VLELGDGVLDGVTVLVIDLSPAGDSRLDAVALAVVRDLFFEFLDELGPLRPRADDGHLAPDDINELRQLIQSEPAEPSSDGSDARIILLSPDRAAAGFRVRIHGAELE